MRAVLGAREQGDRRTASVRPDGQRHLGADATGRGDDPERPDDPERSAVLERPDDPERPAVLERPAVFERPTD